MKTAYYTFYAREATAGVARASGGEDRLVRFTRQPQPRNLPRRENNVISLGEYRERLAEKSWEEPEEDPVAAEESWEEPAEERAPRSRTGRDRGCLEWLELAACAAMIGMALAACLAFLL